MKLGEAFNEMPGVDAIKEMLEQGDLAKTIVDTDNAYWANEEDTLVIAISANSMSGAGLAVGRFAKDCGSDEFDYQFDNTTKQWVCRFWWD